MSVNLESCVLMTLISLTSEFLKINLMFTQILKETLKLLSIAGSFLLSDYFLSSIIPCSNLQRWGIKKGIVEVKCRCPLPQTQHNAPLSAQTQTSRPGVEPHELITAAPLYLVCLLCPDTAGDAGGIDEDGDPTPLQLIYSGKFLPEIRHLAKHLSILAYFSAFLLDPASKDVNELEGQWLTLCDNSKCFPRWIFYHSVGGGQRKYILSAHKRSYRV